MGADRGGGYKDRTKTVQRVLHEGKSAGLMKGMKGLNSSKNFYVILKNRVLRGLINAWRGTFGTKEPFSA